MPHRDRRCGGPCEERALLAGRWRRRGRDAEGDRGRQGHGDERRRRRLRGLVERLRALLAVRLAKRRGMCGSKRIASTIFPFTSGPA